MGCAGDGAARGTRCLPSCPVMQSASRTPAQQRCFTVACVPALFHVLSRLQLNRACGLPVQPAKGGRCCVRMPHASVMLPRPWQGGCAQQWPCTCCLVCCCLAVHAALKTSATTVILAPVRRAPGRASWPNAALPALCCARPAAPGLASPLGFYHGFLPWVLPCTCPPTPPRQEFDTAYIILHAPYCHALSTLLSMQPITGVRHGLRAEQGPAAAAAGGRHQHQRKPHRRRRRGGRALRR